MGQKRKKEQKLIANRLKQKKFTVKYGVYNTPKKFIEKEPEVTEANNKSELTDEQRLIQELESKKRYLKILQDGIGRSSDERGKIEEINRVRSEIEGLSQRLGVEMEKEENTLPSDEEIQAEREKRKEEQREKLRDLEIKLAAHMEIANTGDADTRSRNELERQRLEKEIKNLKDVVPEKERLPINADEQKKVGQNNTNSEQKPPQKQPVKPEHPIPEVKDFYTKLSERMDSAAIAKRVRSEITDIVKAAGLTEPQDLDKFVEKSYSDIKEHVRFIYDPKVVSETKMSIDSSSFFYVAYKSLAESNLSDPNHIITAQKIADVMIKNYSPVTFAGKGFEHYADNYVLKNKEELESQLKALGFTDPNAMVEEVYATLEGRIIKEEDPPKEEVPVDPDSVDMAEFTKSLQPMLDDTDQYKGYNVFTRLAVKNVLKEAGVDVGEESDPLGYADVIRDAYAPEKLSGETPQPMRDVVKNLFVSTYTALTQKGINPSNKIDTAQKLTNEFVARYSPAFTNEGLLKYANNYVIGDNKLFRECLTSLNFSEKEIKSIVDDRIDGTRLHNTIQLFRSMPSLNARISANLSDILKAEGVVADKTNALDINEILADAYTPDKIPNASVPMRDVAKQVFMSTYDAMTKKGVDTKNKVETAQKIADEILKNYSPLAYTEQKLNEYADNYVVNDKKLLRESLTTLKVPENEINALVGSVPENTEKKDSLNDTKEATPITSEARGAVYTEKLKAYNNMYKLNIDSNKFVESVTDAWNLMTSDNKENIPKGQKVLNDIFKDTLKQAFDVEKGVAYDEHRLPEYTEIIKSTNELMRSAMYGFTDMYHNAKRAELFDPTAFGGLNAKDMVALTDGDSFWSKDQKSDEAWEIQSEEAKKIADQWMKEDKPHEKMIAEMKALVKANKENIVSRKEMLDKLTAAEWLLINDENMMIKDPDDPYNPVPNWGNRYWKTLTETREALGIDKHTSMRDMIQSDYAASAKAVNNRSYNEKQIDNYVLDEDVRGLADSMDEQKEQFLIQSAAAKLTKPPENDLSANEMTENRMKFVVTEQNQFLIMKNEPKNNNWILKPENHQELTFISQASAT